MNKTQTIDPEKLQTEVFSLRNKIKNFESENATLKEQLAWLTKQVFGQKSEKIISDTDSNQLSFEGFENLIPEEEKKEIKGHKRSKTKNKGKDKITLPPNLPVEQQVIDIPEEEKICSETGKPLVKIGEEVTYKLAHKPGSYYLKEIIRPKYALPKESEGGIRTAPLPETLLPKCRADESLLAEICTKKFADHLPLYRIKEHLSRLDIQISRPLLSNWVVQSGLALYPLYLEMQKRILSSNNVFADETPIDLQVPGKGKTHQAYMWVLVGGEGPSPPYRTYHFRLNRRHCHIGDLLGEYNNILHSDKYGAYETLAKEKKIIWCPCWSHVRRKFVEAESGDPVFRKWILRKIRYLFLLERVVWNRSREERLEIRKAKELPIIEEILEAVREKLIEGKILPKSKLKEALGYTLSLSPYLKNYTNHADARLDNNVAERAIRPLAIGRKNWMFVGSEESGKSAAVLLSLIQTCRGLDINPREYLEDVMRRIMTHSNQKLQELLPDQWAKNR
jgi:transposase